MQCNKILIIDDDPNILQMISKVLGLRNYVVATAASGEEGLEVMNQFEPNLILLDFNLPGMNGLEILEMIRNDNPFVSVIFLTAESTISNVIRGLDAGADDYIGKPFVFGEFLARIRTHLRIQDLTSQLNRANSKLQELVVIDDLTGLYNMRTIYQKLEESVKDTSAVLMLDMDYFKTVNDNHDHLFGSFVLSEVGGIIKNQLGPNDFGARFGGDEFFIYLDETDNKQATNFCENLRKEIESTLFKSGSDEMHLTISIGFAMRSPYAKKLNAKEFLRIADNALYQAKENGRNKVVQYKANYSL